MKLPSQRDYVCDYHHVTVGLGQNENPRERDPLPPAERNAIARRAEETTVEGAAAAVPGPEFAVACPAEARASLPEPGWVSTWVVSGRWYSLAQCRAPLANVSPGRFPRLTCRCRAWSKSRPWINRAAPSTSHSWWRQ